MLKRFVRPLLAGVGIAGGLAAANRALQNGPLPTNALGGTPRPWTWDGDQIFATEAGTGPLVLLVHGVYAGASSYEYRRLFPLLARDNRVVAFDFLGCGLSDKPKRAYTPDLFVEQIRAAVRTFGGGEPVAVVASSLGAAFAIRAATLEPQLVERVVAICPAGLAGHLDRENAARRPLTQLVRTPLVGEALYNAMSSRASIAWFLRRDAYGAPDHITPEIVDHYYAVTHQPGARYVPAAFLGGRLTCDVARDLPFLSAPLLVLWGEKAPATSPRSEADEFIRLAKDARLVTFADSGLLPHEEEPDDVAMTIEAFLTPLHVEETTP
jgi:pimeloyl-ACP methyl ester carboxylesterase